tara:strand:- start:929 stop:1522 length:594 start_codon:yes stop_codon:yes gene_type:complete
MIRLAIFASGTGSNAANIMRYFKSKTEQISVDCILTNKQDAGVVAVAEQYSVPCFYFSNKEFEQADEPLKMLQSRAIDWIILGGFLRKISPKIINKFTNRILNIHPSLLPKYGGFGMYGDHVHRAVIDAKETESGITVHLVNENFDEGKIVSQKRCSIGSNETLEGLKQKIQELEQAYFPSIIEKYIVENTNSSEPS